MGKTNGGIMSKLADYEYEKQIIAQTSRSSEEYERRIKELIERIKL